MSEDSTLEILNVHNVHVESVGPHCGGAMCYLSTCTKKRIQHPANFEWLSRVDLAVCQL